MQRETYQNPKVTRQGDMFQGTYGQMPLPRVNVLLLIWRVSQKNLTTSEAASSAVRLRDVPLISMGLVKPDENDFEVVVELTKNPICIKRLF